MRRARGKPHLLAINKIDVQKDKKLLLPFIAELTRSHSLRRASISSPRSKKDGLDELLDAIRARLPEGAAAFGEDEITDRSERFLAAELVREQVMRHLSQELPYSTTVEIERFPRGRRHAPKSTR